MAYLFNETKNAVIATQVEVAESFFARAKGLLGRKSMAPSSALLIRRSDGIHTWFMQFPIDVVFVDRKMKVVRVVENVKPFKLVWPVWKAHSVFELPQGTLAINRPQPGDQLHVRA